MATCKNWQELDKELKKAGITTGFRYNSETDRIQGIKFTKNGYSFNGSKIDREYSYSKINWQLHENNRQAQYDNQYQQRQSLQPGNDISMGIVSATENVGSALGNLFDLLPDQNTSGYDVDQTEYLRQQSLRKKKKQRRRL